MVHLACSRVAHGLHSPYRDCLSTQSSGFHGTCMRARFATASNAAHATSGHTLRIRHECTGTAACRRWQARVRTIWRRVRSPSGVCCRLQRSCPATARPDASAVAPLHFQLPGRPGFFTARRHVVSLFGGRCPLLKMVWMCVHDAWRSRTGPTTHASRSSHSDLSQTIQGYGYRIRIRNTELRPKYGIRIRNTDTEYGSALKIQIRRRNTNTEYGSAPKI